MFQRVSSCQSRKYCISKYCATDRNKVRTTLYITYQLTVKIQKATLVPQKVSRKEENRKERRKTKTMPGRNWRRGRGGRGSRGRGADLGDSFVAVIRVHRRTTRKQSLQKAHQRISGKIQAGSLPKTFLLILTWKHRLTIDCVTVPRSAPWRNGKSTYHSVSELMLTCFKNDMIFNVND